MQPVARILLEGRMVAPETRAVLEALGQAPDRDEVRFVGGCLRDSLLGRPVSDIDLATRCRPEESQRRLEAAGIRALPTGIEHGTVTAISGGRPYEITTLREDVESLGRHARVVFTDDWQADAARRDFTMNALSCDPEGNLYDYFGGREDLAAGRVRFVGEAARRIEEDYLRLLRFFRFQAHYGKGAPDQAALAAARTHAPGLARLSAERIGSELFKLLGAPAPAALLALMRELEILQRILPEGRDTAVLAALAEPGEPDPVLRLAALHDPAPSLGQALGERLRCSKAETERLAQLLDPPDLNDLGEPGLGEPALRRLLYRLGAPAVADLLALAEARAGAADRPLPPEALEAARRVVSAWRPIGFPLRGRDALALGISAGPAMGEALKAVEAWWIAEDFRPDRAACLARLAALAET